MQTLKASAQYALAALKACGVEQASCYIKRDAVTEANYQNNEFTLLRSFVIDKLILKASTGTKVSAIVDFQLDSNALDLTIKRCLAKLNGAEEDAFAGILESSNVCSFTRGELVPDVDTMLENIRDCIAYQTEYHPDDSLAESIIAHHCFKEVFHSSYGAKLDSTLGYYQRKRFFKPNLKESFAGFGEMAVPYDAALLKEKKSSLEAPFVGTAIYCPISLYRDWWLFHLGTFGEDSTVGESMPPNKWSGKYGEQVASVSLSVSNAPLDPRLCNASPFTPEGLLIHNTKIIENGVLRDLWYSLKAARKLGRKANIQPLDFNDDTTLLSNTIIEPGTQPLKEIIASIKKGIIIYQMPGSTPNDPDGNIRGLIRKGMLIESGKVVRPVSEVMVRTNIYDMYNNIRAISSESTHMGGDILPWIAFDGIQFQ